MDYTREHPFISTIQQRILLNKKGSSKQTFHIELFADDSLDYEPGDSIALLPQYEPEQIAPLLDWFGEDQTFSYRSHTALLSQLLQYQINIDTLSKKFLQALCEYPIENRELMDQLLSDKDQCTAFLNEHTLETALQFFSPQSIDVQDILDTLLPLLPRMYSIASSKKEHPHSIHLTVAYFSYMKQGRICRGIGSHFLCAGAQLAETPIPLYIQKSQHFRLPSSLDIPIIMIGPGTGVAPFRAFLQERRSLGNHGKHWLFFGDRNRNTDFYYEDFFTQFQKTHHLDLDLAFSRDQASKLYVQNQMEKNGPQLWKWLQDGAYIYICGDAKRMARDVQNTLVSIIEREGQLEREEAQAFFKQMRKDKRLRLDVY